MTIRYNHHMMPYPTAANFSEWDNRWFGAGSGSGAYSRIDSGGAVNNGPFVRKTWSVAPSSNGDTGFEVAGGFAAGGRYPATPGLGQISWSGYMRSNVANKSAVARVQFYNAGGSMISDQAGTPVIMAANTWTRVSIQPSTPALATTMVLILDSAAGGGATTWAAGNTLDGTNVMLDYAFATVRDYTDGNNPFGGWLGTVGFSQSILYEPVITLTQYNDYNPVPRCEVLVVDVPPGTSTLRRAAEGRTMEVRGGVNRPAAAGLTLLDTEIPFGVPAVYQVECFLNGISLGFSATATTTLVQDSICLHQPLDPTYGTALEMTDESLKDLKRGFSGEVVYTDGATVGRWIGGRRRGLTDVNLTLGASSEAAADLVQGAFGGYVKDQVPVVCIRTPPGYGRIPRVLFLAVPDPIENDVNVRFGGGLVDFQIVGDEVAPPYPGLVASLLGYDDTDAFYSTYSAIDTAYGTYLARDRDYSKAGYA